MKDGYADISSSGGLQGSFRNGFRAYQNYEWRWKASLALEFPLCATFFRSPCRLQNITEFEELLGLLRCERTKNHLQSDHLFPVFNDRRPSVLDGQIDSTNGQNAFQVKPDDYV